MKIDHTEYHILTTSHKFLGWAFQRPPHSRLSWSSPPKSSKYHRQPAPSLPTMESASIPSRRPAMCSWNTDRNYGWFHAIESVRRRHFIECAASGASHSLPRTVKLFICIWICRQHSIFIYIYIWGNPPQALSLLLIVGGSNFCF